jgi:hypothetical protein
MGDDGFCESLSGSRVQRRHVMFQPVNIKKAMRGLAVSFDLKSPDLRVPRRDRLIVLSETSTRNPVRTVVIKDKSTAIHPMVGPEFVA